MGIKTQKNWRDRYLPKAADQLTPLIEGIEREKTITPKQAALAGALVSSAIEKEFRHKLEGVMAGIMGASGIEDSPYDGLADGLKEIGISAKLADGVETQLQEEFKGSKLGNRSTTVRGA